MKKEKRVLSLYLILVFALSAPIEVAWIIMGEAGTFMGMVVMMVPAVVALVLKFIFYKKQKVLALGLGKPVYYLYAVLIPLGYIGLSYILYWLIIPGAFVRLDASVSAGIIILNMFITLLIGLVVDAPFTFGEELGWRGLMYPTMNKLWNRNKALVLSGLIWAVWHLPLLVSGVYMAGAPLLYQVPMFVLQVMALTVIVSWLRMKSGSVWPAVVWHGAHNTLDQAVFPHLTGGDNKMYFISETGMLTTLLAVLAAVALLVFGKFDKQAMAEQEQTPQTT